MDGVEGIGSTSWSTYFSAKMAKTVAEARPSHLIEAYESGAGMTGALEMRRESLSENLTNAGFMDVHAGIITGLKTFLEQGTVEPETVETGLDIRMAGELASLMGSEVTGEVNLVLRILARVDPGRVATLLK